MLYTFDSYGIVEEFASYSASFASFCMFGYRVWALWTASLKVHLLQGGHDHAER